MAKGGEYERQLCHQLSRWWTVGARDDVLWRTGGSGGRATMRGRKGKSTYGQYGDVCATDPIADPLMRFITIEIKRGYSRATLHDLFDAPARAAKQQYTKWFEQTLLAHENAGSRYWLLIHRRDKREPLAVMPQGLADCSAVYAKGFRCGSLDVEVADDFCRIAFTPLAKWLAATQPERIRKFMGMEK